VTRSWGGERPREALARSVGGRAAVSIWSWLRLLT